MLGTNSTLLFKTKSGGRYVYDDNTGAVFPTNDVLAKALRLRRKFPPRRVRTELLREFPEVFVEGALKFVERWIRVYGGLYRSPREGALLCHRMNSGSRVNNVGAILRDPTHFRQLILNLTEDCNLMCKYCVYSDNYSHTRPPAKKYMDFETGRKALDYFFSLNRRIARRNPAKLLAVNFYGGEPLLRLSTMKKLVHHARRNSPLPFLLFVSTNGLLLNDEAVDFIVENKIHVAVSLDGTEENHDRNRVTSGGKGSWNVVMRNLSRFTERYPEYVRLRVSLLCVYDFQTDLEANARFFEQASLPRVSFVNAVSPGTDDDDYYSRFSEEQKKRFAEQRLNLMRGYVRHLLDGTRATDFIEVFCGGRFINVLFRTAALDRRPDILPFTGSCLPGEKISVRTDGVFDICERVNDTMPIGDVDRGLDMDAVARVIERYLSALGKKCLSCPATKLCGVCFGDGVTMNDGGFSVPARRCAAIRSEVKQNLSLIYSVRERKADAFGRIDEILSRPEKVHTF